MLVVGSGLAGLLAALEAAKAGRDVSLIDKGLMGKSGCTVGAQNIAAVIPGEIDGDNTEVHYQDTIGAGKRINDPRLARVMVEEAEQGIRQLEEMGMTFEHQRNGRYQLLDMNGHRFPRSLFHSDRTGRLMVHVIQAEARRLGVRMHSDIMVTALLRNAGRIQGVIGIDFAAGCLVQISAKAVVIATGGAGQLYPITTNFDQSTGDGLALALKAGGILKDLEMVQFYPAVMIAPQALRGCALGMAQFGKLYNSKGERFMEKYYPGLMENAGRDILSFSIYSEIRTGFGTENGGVYLDLTELPQSILEAFPEEARALKHFGVDLRYERVEICPGAHYFMGGIKINEQGETTLEGLYAAGEVTGGVHGANRLGNNSLLDCLVFGRRAGLAAGLYAGNAKLCPPGQESLQEESDRLMRILDKGAGIYKPHHVQAELQEMMREHLGIIRNTQGLLLAKKRLAHLKQDLEEHTGVTGGGILFNRQMMDYLQVENMLMLAEGMVMSALARKESRGAHFMEDYPESDDDLWLVNTETRMTDGTSQVTLVPCNG